MSTRFKTGEEVPAAGTYRFDGFVDDGVDCTPTADEKRSYLEPGDRFPPIASCDEAAYWRRQYR